MKAVRNIEGALSLQSSGTFWGVGHDIASNFSANRLDDDDQFRNMKPMLWYTYPDKTFTI